MASHKLGLEIPDTLNTCILRVVDLSVYDDNIATKCPTLQISVPGFSGSVFVDDVATNFSYNLTACDLKAQTINCGTDFNDLPDMVYVIKYSVSPNDQVYVEYNHLRITKALVKLKAVYCDLDQLNCNPTEDIKKKREMVKQIREYLYGAKALVETCRQVNDGVALYKEALRLLDKINCNHCN